MDILSYKMGINKGRGEGATGEMTIEKNGTYNVSSYKNAIINVTLIALESDTDKIAIEDEEGNVIEI